MSSHLLQLADSAEVVGHDCDGPPAFAVAGSLDVRLHHQLLQTCMLKISHDMTTSLSNTKRMVLVGLHCRDVMSLDCRWLGQQQCSGLC